MTVDEILTMKSELGYSNMRLANESGVPVGTVNKVISGASAHPRYKTLYAMWTTLNNKRKEILNQKSCTAGGYSISEIPHEELVKESPAAYFTSEIKGPENYTIEDYAKLPDDHRAELIDGYFYNLASPFTRHQRVVRSLSFQFESWIQSGNCTCEVFQAPLDVRLSESDNKTVVQPDVMVICNTDIIKEDGITGAPDFIAEIVSPSSKRNDYYRKVAKYAESGVREYWIIDPEKSVLVMYNFEQELPPQILPLEGSVPVAIYNGKLQIDLDQF